MYNRLLLLNFHMMSVCVCVCVYKKGNLKLLSSFIIIIKSMDDERKFVVQFNSIQILLLWMNVQQTTTKKNTIKVDTTTDNNSDNTLK